MKRLFLVILSALVPSSLYAASILPVVTSSPGTTYQTAALTGYMTTSANMVGSVVTVNFAGGGTASAIWTPTGAFGTGWSLTESGDTFGGIWSLTNSGSAAISEFDFNGVPGNTTFDIVNGPEDTPGSANGLPFSSVNGPAGLSVAALYTNELRVGGIFYGDEYTALDVMLGGSGLISGQALTFVADTDNAVASSGITLATTPEPSSFLLMGTGLFGIVTTAKRRFRS